jgi:spore maturation protein CgeB
VKIVIFGLSITSSWGNGHATTYRGLVRELDARGHDVLFLERDASWYADNRDLPKPPYGRTVVYRTIAELKRRFARHVRDAGVVIVGSYVPNGIEIGRWVTRVAKGVKAFYDIDTPVTLSKLQHGDTDYLTRALIPKYDLYLSFTGGPTLERLQQEYGSPAARALYCSFDPALYYPEAMPLRWDLGYMGTYSDDRQPTLERLLLEPARRLPRSKFVVAGPQYPTTIVWPKNVQRKAHCAPKQHRKFYSAQRYTLNVTRADMIAAGHSPSVRLFEAAACGTPIISDAWPGLDKLFKPRREILIARGPKDTLAYLNDMSESERREIGLRARERVLADHTAAHRAAQLERYVAEVMTGTLMA